VVRAYVLKRYEENDFKSNRKGVSMNYVEKAKAWAKANPKVAIVIAFVVVGVLANALGLG
jgi:hypothetical protein